jgi:hypothetical protein
LKRGKRFEVTEMGWDKGRYYTRSQKCDGRVVREYVGIGYPAKLAARLDANERKKRQAKRTARRAQQAELDALDSEINALTDLADAVARAALLAAGFHQHKRGEWRRRRGQSKGTTIGDASQDQQGIS